MNSESEALRPTPSTPAQDPASPVEAGPANAAPGGDFRLGRVLKVVGPLALLLLGGAVFLGFFNGAQRIERWLRPSLVPTHGQVLWNGQPLTDGQIATTSRGLPGSIGFLDKHGRFKLQTDIDGTYTDGAFVGEHVVTVAWNVTQPGASPPLLKTPVIYSMPATSPLRITVSPSSAKRDFTITIEGEPPPPTPPPPGPPPATQDEPKIDARPRGDDANQPTNDAPSDAKKS